MSASDLDMENIVEAWNRCCITTAQLAKFKHRLEMTLETLQAMGEKGFLISGLRSRLESIEQMQEDRRRF